MIRINLGLTIYFTICNIQKKKHTGSTRSPKRKGVIFCDQKMIQVLQCYELILSKKYQPCQIRIWLQ